MSQDHTPGPWSWRRSRVKRYLIGAGGEHAVVEIPNDMTSYHPTCRGRVEANARLIAAAPDLLAALTSLVAIITTIREEQVSGQMRLGSSEREKRERATVYAAEIQRRAMQIEDAVLHATEAMAKAKE